MYAVVISNMPVFLLNILRWVNKIYIKSNKKITEFVLQRMSGHDSHQKGILRQGSMPLPTNEYACQSCELHPGWNHRVKVYNIARYYILKYVWVKDKVTTY